MKTLYHEPVIIYIRQNELGYPTYYATWFTNENGRPIGGHEIGNPSENTLILLKRLAEIMELPN